MENRFLDNKVIIKYCKDYYNIINYKILPNDKLSDKIVSIYQSYLFTSSISDKTFIKRATALNNAVNRYFTDNDFKKLVYNSLSNLKAPKNESNVLIFIVNTIIELYNSYLDGYTRNIYIPRII